MEALSSLFGGEDSLTQKRITVLQLHVDELIKHVASRKAEAHAAQAKLAAVEKQHAAQRRNERKLIRKFEGMQAELRKAHASQRKAEVRAAQMEEAAQSEATTSAAGDVAGAGGVVGGVAGGAAVVVANGGTAGAAAGGAGQPRAAVQRQERHLYAHHLGRGELLRHARLAQHDRGLLPRE